MIDLLKKLSEDDDQVSRTVKGSELSPGLYKKVLSLRSLSDQIAELQDKFNASLEKLSKETGMDKRADKEMADLKKEVKEALVEEEIKVVELKDTLLTLIGRKVPVSAEKVLEALADQLTDDIKAIIQSKIEAMNAFTYEMRFKKNESVLSDFINYIKQIVGNIVSGTKKFAGNVDKFKAAVAQASNESRIAESYQDASDVVKSLGGRVDSRINWDVAYFETREQAAKFMEWTKANKFEIRDNGTMIHFRTMRESNESKIPKLDQGEQWIFNDLKRRNPKETDEFILKVMVNTVEGDETQLSDGLKAWAKRKGFLGTEEA
jgi:hypothetical protein